MKKIINFCLCLLMVVALIGCSKKEQSDWKYVKEKGSLIVGYTLYAPICYHDSEGKLVGFDTEFAREICSRLGITAEFIEINWDLKETELQSKNIDCICNGMTITEPLKKSLAISMPYLSNRQCLITKSDKVAEYEKSVDGIDISVEQGSSGEIVATTLPYFAKTKITPVDSQAKALMEVKAGIADATVVDYVASVGSIGEGTDYADLVVADCPIGDSEFYGIGLRKDSDLLPLIDNIITQMKEDGSLLELAKKYKLEGLLVK